MKKLTIVLAAVFAMASVSAFAGNHTKCKAGEEMKDGKCVKHEDHK